MVLLFDYTLALALQTISCQEEKHFPIHLEDKERTHHNADEIMERYGDSLHALVSLLNQRYALDCNLLAWLEHDEDEVSSFLNEACSNTLHHASFKAPSHVRVWLGEKGFIIGIEQKGKGFDAQTVHHLDKKENKGAAFDFYRKSKGKIFFDHPPDARIVYFEFLLH